MAYYQTYEENGEIVPWFAQHCANINAEPYEYIQKQMSKGLMEVYGHRCRQCGRTWADTNDDGLTQCYQGDGCDT